MRSLYTDCACCSGKAGSPQTTSTDTGTSVAALWQSIFSVKFDAMYLMLRIGREMDAKHPRRKKFLVDLSIAIFVQHKGNRKHLMRAREAAGLEGPPTCAERVKFIHRVVGEPESVAQQMILVLKAHREINSQCRSQAEAAGMEVDNLTVADIVYPLITKRLVCVFQQQLVYVRNGCISNDPDRPSFGALPITAWHKQGGSCPFGTRPNLLLSAWHRSRGLRCTLGLVDSWIQSPPPASSRQESSSRQHATKGIFVTLVNIQYNQKHVLFCILSH